MIFSFRFFVFPNIAKNTDSSLRLLVEEKGRKITKETIAFIKCLNYKIIILIWGDYNVSIKIFVINIRFFYSN